MYNESLKSISRTRVVLIQIIRHYKSNTKKVLLLSTIRREEERLLNLEKRRMKDKIFMLLLSISAVALISCEAVPPPECSASCAPLTDVSGGSFGPLVIS